MSTLSVGFDFLLVGAALMTLLNGLFTAAIVPGIDRFSRRFFVIFFAVLVLYGLLALTEEYFEVGPDTEPVLMVIYYFETLLASSIMPLLTIYLLHCCQESFKHSRLFCFEILLWAAFFIILSISPFTEKFYYISSGNEFSRGPLYPLITASISAILVLPLIGVIRRRNRLSVKCYYAFLVGLIPMNIAIFIHFFVNAFTLFGFGIALSGFSMYLIIISDQIEQYMRQQQEIADQRAKVMVLKMRPHFIYNTLMSIYSLCNQNPQKARQVTLDFTEYLRKNFNAIASENTIPFSVELEHTLAYLAVEQAQHEEMLVVEYDTQFTQFRLPPLTLQPIAENAVKHCLNPYSGPLHILIRTYHSDGAAVITVDDDGVGFMTPDDSGPHIALTNIRQRLEMMCKGKLTIMPGEGGGTRVTIRIPD